MSASLPHRGTMWEPAALQAFWDHSATIQGGTAYLSRARFDSHSGAFGVYGRTNMRSTLSAIIVAAGLAVLGSAAQAAPVAPAPLGVAQDGGVVQVQMMRGERRMMRHRMMRRHMMRRRMMRRGM